MELKYDTGVQFGWGAFETIAINNNQPQFLDLHLQRLQKACQFLKLPFPQKLILSELEQYLQNHKLNFHSLKILITENNLKLSHRANPYTFPQHHQGFKITLSTILRNETDPLIYHKTCNYGVNILAKQQAKVQGYDEPIFLNTEKKLTEGATTNIFLYLDNKLVTPPISSGLLPGIMRQKIIELLKVEEKTLTLTDLQRAQYVFLTNSLMGMMPVSSYNDISYSTTYPFPIYDNSLAIIKP